MNCLSFKTCKTYCNQKKYLHGTVNDYFFLARNCNFAPTQVALLKSRIILLILSRINICHTRKYRYQVRAAKDEMPVCALTKLILLHRNVQAIAYGNIRIGSEHSFVSSRHRVEFQVNTDVLGELFASIFIPKCRRKRTVIQGVKTESTIISTMLTLATFRKQGIRPSSVAQQYIREIVLS